MKSVQIHLTEEQVIALDELVKSGYFSSRNEAAREAVRRLIFEFSRKCKLRLGIGGSFKLTNSEMLDKLKTGDTRPNPKVLLKIKQLLGSEH